LRRGPPTRRAVGAAIRRWNSSSLTVTPRQDPRRLGAHRGVAIGRRVYYRYKRVDLLLGVDSGRLHLARFSGKEEGIPLDDILHVKVLVGRFGPEQLHTLIDAFAR
jgi:hypothetical protein